MKKVDKKRILGRRLAEDITAEQLKSATGGSPSNCMGDYDDVDYISY